MDDLERQLHSYWSDITDGYPEPEVGPMLGVLQLEPESPRADDYWGETITLESPHEQPERSRWYVGVAAVTLLVVAFGGLLVLSRTIGLNPGAEIAAPNILPEDFYRTILPSSGAWGSSTDLSPRSLPKPDIRDAAPGDDGERPLPLGAVTELPAGVYPDLLLGTCQGGPCSHREHVQDRGYPHLFASDDPTREVGTVPSRTPLFIRQGFVNETGEPLGESFDVALYVFAPDTPTEFGGVIRGPTTRYSSDYIIRGETDRCGPDFETQDGPVTCEWFVHEFPDGFPAGNFVMWAVWEAPCSAWIDLGYTNFCADTNEVMSFFSTAVDLSFAPSAPTVARDNGLAFSSREFDEYRATADRFGSAAAFGTPLPDFEGAAQGDDASGPAPLGTGATLPSDDYLDFLFEFCIDDSGVCFRDAHFVQPSDPTRGSGPYTSGRPFYVRQGFVNDTSEPLGQGFDVSLYAFEMDENREFVGVTTRYTSDYVVQGVTEQCGPTYRDQTGPVTCEWFVHEFPDGLPEGRFALWAVWEAPCSAWIDLGFTDSCADPSEVVSFFSSGVDSPFGPFPPDYNQQNEARSDGG